MRPSEPRPSHRFVFDQHVNGPALRQLRSQGVDVLHVAEVGLAVADDLDVFQWAVREGRIVVSRNYRDFAPVVDAFARQGEPFPGVLFFPTSIRQTDVGQHVRALREWIGSALARGVNPAENTFDWIG